jgi:hypothetical protein
MNHPSGLGSRPAPISPSDSGYAGPALTTTSALNLRRQVCDAAKRTHTVADLGPSDDTLALTV